MQFCFTHSKLKVLFHISSQNRNSKKLKKYIKNSILSPMYKIGIDARFYSPKATGIGRHVSELIAHLAHLDAQNQYTIFLNEKNFEAFHPPGKNFSAEKTTAPHYSWHEQTLFLRQIQRHAFDLMVFPQFNVPYFYRGKYTVTIHDLTIHFYPGKKANRLKHFLYKKIIQNAAKKSTHIFAVSENTKKDIIEHLGTPSEKISVTHNGVSSQFQPEKDIEKLKKFRKKHQLPEKYFLYTGVMRCHKNILGLVRAYAAFLSQNPPERIDLVLAGPKDPLYTPEIESEIKKLKISDRVHLTGFFPESEFQNLFTASHAFIFPSFYEGFGIPPLEAMQCDIPVACADTSSLPEICGSAALFFDPHDKTSIVHALQKIAFDPTLRRQLIVKGRSQWKKFSWDRMSQQMWGEYKTILNR
jgi:glycosyltransferase involved in cell wall biosynthesis